MSLKSFLLGQGLAIGEDITIGAAMHSWFAKRTPQFADAVYKRLSEDDGRIDLLTFIWKLSPEWARDKWLERYARACHESKTKPGVEDRFVKLAVHIMHRETGKPEGAEWVFVRMAAETDEEFERDLQLVENDSIEQLIGKLRKYAAELFQPIGEGIVYVYNQLTAPDVALANNLRQLREGNQHGLLAHRPGAPVGNFSTIGQAWELILDVLHNVDAAMRMAIYITVLGAIMVYFAFLGLKYALPTSTARFILAIMTLGMVVAAVFAAVGRVAPVAWIAAYRIPQIKKVPRILWTTLSVVLLLLLYAIFVPIEASPSVAAIIPVLVTTLLVLWFSWENEFFHKTAPKLVTLLIVGCTVWFFMCKAAPTAMGPGLDAAHSSFDNAVNQLLHGGVSDRTDLVARVGQSTRVDLTKHRGKQVDFENSVAIQITNQRGQQFQRTPQGEYWELVEGQWVPVPDLMFHTWGKDASGSWVITRSDFNPTNYLEIVAVSQQGPAAVLYF
jgi:hypothetical protein